MKKLLGVVCAMLLSGSVMAANPQVEIRTNLGPITVELFPDKAPKTVENFLEYAKSGFYKDSIFHRVIPGFMIQGGGFGTDMKQKKTREAILLEANNGLKNDVGTIAMARTSSPNSATSQFFINVANNDALNYRPGMPGYAVFGKVVKGMDVVEKITQIPTGAGGPFPQDVPQKQVIIEDVTPLEAK
jgi:peptidyl-prolyl cis-trans isomerase A (cyclophilin A)/peptidyl-prolyl cis-trans isomerase B (cyclophilin B)